MKKPLIFQYLETSEKDQSHQESYEYSSALNLNVIKGSDQPAVYAASLDTDTFTKAQVDSSETDDDFKSTLIHLLDTNLNTRSQIDDTGSDDDSVRLN
jgi:hypothetical protein